MAVKDVLKVNRKTFFNPTAWMGLSEIKRNNLIMWQSIRGVVVPEQPQRVETFEEAVARLGLTEKDLEEREATFFTFVISFLVLGACTFIYSFYLLFFDKTLMGWLLCIGVTGLLLAQAFRFHFWYTEVKARKLGFTLKDWWQSLRKTKGIAKE